MVFSVLEKIDFASNADDDAPYLTGDVARQANDSLENASGELFAGLLVIKWKSVLLGSSNYSLQ